MCYMCYLQPYAQRQANHATTTRTPKYIRYQDQACNNSQPDLDGESRRCAVRGDLEHRAPLGEPRTLRVVLLCALYEPVEAGAPGLHLVPSGQGRKARVHLDAGDDANLLEALNERGAVSVVLEEGLLIKDGTRDVVAEVGRGEEHALRHK